MREERKKYTKEFKEEAIRLAETSGKTISSVARDLDINDGLLRRWRLDAMKDGEACFPGNGRQALTPEEEEIKRLKRELEIIKEERDILKKAVAIFSKTPK